MVESKEKEMGGEPGVLSEGTPRQSCRLWGREAEGS
jgi:hypothetical protein